jgi:hypothetical protein
VVTFNDFIRSTGMDKSGHKKIRFCAEKANQDSFDYFWIDTCCTIQTHHRRQRPMKRVAYTAENSGRIYIAFQYKRINISLLSYLFILRSFVLHYNLRTRSCNEAPESDPQAVPAKQWLSSG